MISILVVITATSSSSSSADNNAGNNNSKKEQYPAYCTGGGNPCYGLASLLLRQAVAASAIVCSGSDNVHKTDEAAGEGAED